MRNERIILWILTIEIGLLAGIISGIHVLAPSKAASLYLYEFLGACSAAVITTYGIYKMHDIT